MDIQAEKEDGASRVCKAPPFSGQFRLGKRGSAAEITTHYDVSGGIRQFFED